MPEQKWHERPVPWLLFAWAVGIFSLLMSAMYLQNQEIARALAAETAQRVAGDSANIQLSNDIKARLTGIETSLSSLDQRITELRADIKALPK